MQQIINGIDKLSGILQEVGCRKLFLVIDSSYPFLNIKDAIEALPVEEKVKFSDFTPNPLYEQVCNGIELLKQSKCDTILAVGGGSAIDVAKCIKLAVLAKEGNAAIIPPLVSTRVECDGAKLPFIAIPTTAGTGSESTHNAVMYYEGAKQTVTNDGVLPDYAILEHSVLKTLPLYQKKCTMMDALCQGIESWWSVNSTEESYEYSRKAIELIIANWRKYIFENDDDAAAQIMLAANYGGRAINITQTTAAHAFSYKITSLYKLPHGHAVAVGLPVIWEYMLGNMDKCIDVRGQDYLSDIFNQIARAMGCNTPKLAISTFRQMMVEVELVNPGSENKEEDLIILSTSVNPVRLKNNPVKLSEETIKYLYSIIVHNPINTTEGLVSCIIPTYKRCNLLERAIDSVLQQTYSHYEILVVDDNEPGSKESDEVKDVLKVYATNRKVVYVPQKEHINGAVARNEGIKASKGEYIAFLDDDDEWMPEKLEKQVAILDNDQTIGGVFCIANIYKDNIIITNAASFSEGDMQYRILRRDVRIANSTFMGRKSIIQQFGGFNPKLRRHQDIQFMADFAGIARIVPLNLPLTKMHADSTINRPTAQRLKELKNDFFECEKNNINKLSYFKRKRVYGAHYFELAYVAFKEKQYRLGIEAILKVGFSPMSYIDLLKRFSER